MMKNIRLTLLFALMVILPLNTFASKSADSNNNKIDIPSIVLEHLSDSYEWHLFSYEGHDVAIPLPIILRNSETGEWTFTTAHNLSEPFYFDETHHGKIYQRLSDGSSLRPIDLSITKAVTQIWIAVIVLLAVFAHCALWYKKRTKKDKAPKGFVGLMEMFVMALYDDMIRPALGEKNCDKFAPYILTVFFFIFACNILGLIPIFPGGVNLTGNINITLFLAAFTMLVINIFGNKEYWKEILWPNVPMFLKVPVPLMPVIEIFGLFTKPFALMIRLFANMMGGHAVLLSFTCVIFLGWSMGIGFGIGLNIFSLLMLLFMNALEILVAFIQAYVFAMLTSVFIGMAHPVHHPD